MCVLFYFHLKNISKDKLLINFILFFIVKMIFMLKHIIITEIPLFLKYQIKNEIKYY